VISFPATSRFLFDWLYHSTFFLACQGVFENIQFQKWNFKKDYCFYGSFEEIENSYFGIKSRRRKSVAFRRCVGKKRKKRIFPLAIHKKR
jgi:hypothetical protein